jgi:endonuclease G
MKIPALCGTALLVATSACTTKPPTCADHFAGAAAPVITSPSLANKTQLLCFEGYATTHSGVSRTPPWSAEHLTKQRVEAAKKIKRKNTFHAEERLLPSDIRYAR